MGTPTLSITNSKGIQVNLLNEAPSVKKIKYRYHCMEPGCQKSFTTSGHLARHHRIHTGEKNFCCLYPGCPSRFSRQDNMMQHYRTHISSSSRSNQQQQQQQRQQQQQQQQQQQYTPKPYSYYHGSEKMHVQPLYPNTTYCTGSHTNQHTFTSEFKYQSSSYFY